METQLDYEADVLLAVFPSASVAAEAERTLEAAGIESSQSPLTPGRYQLADMRSGSRFRAGIGAAIVGAIVGGGIGAGFALWLFGASGMVIAGLAVAGAFGGAIVGSMFGIERVSRYDDNVATSMQISPESSAVVVRARIPPTGAHESAREIVERAGAVALLDVPTYEATVRGTTEPTVVESTSAGDAAAAPQGASFGPTRARGVDEGNQESHKPAA